MYFKDMEKDKMQYDGAPVIAMKDLSISYDKGKYAV